MQPGVLSTACPGEMRNENENKSNFIQNKTEMK